MKFWSRRAVIAVTLMLATTLPSFGYMHARRGPTSPGLFKKRSGSRSGAKPAGPRMIESDRATEIQAALIKTGYLTGTPSGHWDSESQAAMQRLQGSKGWQTKLTPDSRALIYLGLGPASGPAASSIKTQDSGTKEISQADASSGGLQNQSSFNTQK